MGNYRSILDLKRLSIKQMSGHLGTLIVSYLLKIFLIVFALLVIANIFPRNTPIGYIAYLISLLIIILMGGILETGLCYTYLCSSCNMNTSIGNLFYGFKHHPDKAIVIQFILKIIKGICIVPFIIVILTLLSTPDFTNAYNEFINFMNSTVSADVFTLINKENELFAPFFQIMQKGLNALYLGLLLYFILTLPLKPLFFLIVDFPKCSLKELFKKSFSVMKGNYIRYCLLILSFIPLFLLTFITSGLALIIVLPYLKLAITNFYLEIMSIKNKEVMKK